MLFVMINETVNGMQIQTEIYKSPTIFVANEHRKETFFSLPAQF